jgi:hypothetical protein
VLRGPDSLWKWCLPDKVELTPHQRKGNFDAVCAAERLVLYDDFNTEYIDPSKWFGGEFGPAFPRAGTEASRQIQDHRLRLMYRSYGPTGAYSERPRTEFVLMFRDPAAVTTIQATVQVTDVANTGCPGGFESTEAWATLGGRFFGNAASTAEGQVQDMVAFIGVMGRSGTAGQPDVVQARALVFHCANRPCTTGTELFRRDLGPVTRGERVRLRLQWDRDNHRFIFQRDEAPEVLAPYAESDMNPPGIPVKLLNTMLFVPSCAATPRPMAFMDALFDDVMVNESAAPRAER